MTIKGYRLKAVLFDFDGTLTLPGALNFPVIRRSIGCPDGKPILEFIDALPDADIRRQAHAALDRFELEAAALSHPNAGAEEMIRWIRRRGLGLGIITRNSKASVLRALDHFKGVDPEDFNIIITRDDPVAPKPSPDSVFLAAARLGADPENILVVGDFLFDTRSGRAAKSLTALLDPAADPRLRDEPCDFRVRRLDELYDIILAGLPLSAGKLPNDILQTYLSQFRFEDPSVLINPGVGEDIAAVDVARSEVLILKSDPITFATDAISRYAVQVNANDIATSGAEPRWFLATLLLPCGVTPSDVRQLMRELADTCETWDITLCGGHTEITDAVNRPVVVGMMAGTVKRTDLIDKKMMRPGDCVLMTKGVAVEGTAIIARQFRKQLLAAGVDEMEIESGKAYIERIGIVDEARIASRGRMATAMHDVTEGGLATALMELSVAGGRKIAVDMDKIPVYPLSRKICDALQINPLGLIGSGSLLICCREPDCDRLVSALLDKGIDVAVIGTVKDAGAGIEAFKDGLAVVWPSFAVDEITKLF